MANITQSGYRSGLRGAWLSLAAYVVLSGLKLAVGIWSGSKALTADGVNNLTDVIGATAVILGLRVALLPPDANHRYGHQKAETVAALVVAVIMGLIGLDLAADAATTLLRGPGPRLHPASAWVSALAALVMLGVHRYNLGIARRTGSEAMAAMAQDNRSDALVSLGVAAGIAGSRVGWGWADPLAGFVVSIAIIRTAWRIGVDAAYALTDGFDQATLDQLQARVAAVTGVVQVRSLRARRLGPTTSVEVTIGVPDDLDITAAHRVSDRVESALLGELSVDHVHVHVEPVAPAPRDAVR